MLFYEPKFPKYASQIRVRNALYVSVLFYEPKFPKSDKTTSPVRVSTTFSALLRAEIPKMHPGSRMQSQSMTFSALLRAEIPKIAWNAACRTEVVSLSVLFYEPKFPKFNCNLHVVCCCRAFQCSSTSRNSQNEMLLHSRVHNCVPFSALLRAEIPKMRIRISWPFSL